MAQLLAVNAVTCGNEQTVEVKRFLEEIIRALLDAIDSRLDVSVTGDHHHRHIGAVAVGLLESCEQLCTIHLRHLDVAVDKVVTAGLRHLDTLSTVLGNIN